MAPPAGGGFLHGALGAAAGVAGGVLLADSIRGLFGGHNNPMGIASGVPGFGGSGFGSSGLGGGETVVNNYYGNDSSSQQQAQDALQDQDQDQDDIQDAVRRFRLFVRRRHPRRLTSLRPPRILRSGRFNSYITMTFVPTPTRP